MMDEAPSQIPDAVPAVTHPSFLKILGSLFNPSIVVCGRGCSSVLEEKDLINTTYN